jgi:hypothetical protein
MKNNISKFDEMVIGALRDDVFSAVEETELEERSEDSTKAGVFAASSKNGDLDMFFRLHISIKKLVFAIGSLGGAIAVIINLNPAIWQTIQHLLTGK